MTQLIEKRLVIIRGLPGSGKSTLAKQLKKEGYEHFEADQYFIGTDGQYRYDKTKMKDAHLWCQESVRRALKEGKKVVVSNTFTQKWEIKPYQNMDVPYQIIECTGDYGSIHNVPTEVLELMKSRWETL